MGRWTAYIKPSRDEKLAKRRATYASRRDEHAVMRHNLKLDPGHRERIRQLSRDSQARHPARAMLQDAKKRARRLNLPFDLREADIVIPQTCPIDGLPLKSGRGSGSGNGFHRTSFRAPSLDRVIPRRGYVRGNVKVISAFWNIRKREMSASDLRRLANYIDPQPGASPEHLLSFGG